jgi:hypothetical protein
MANLYTEKDVLDFWDSHLTIEAKMEQAEIEAIRKDIATARKYIQDALARYRKDKTRSRSKTKAADPFADLEGYNIRQDIQDAFGWEFISEAEMDRLLALWDLREASKNKQQLEDRVTEMLEIAVRSCSAPYDEKLYDWDKKQEQRRKAARQIASENLERSAK